MERVADFVVGGGRRGWSLVGLGIFATYKYAMTTLHPGVDCWAVICRQDDWVEQSIVRLNSTVANAKEDWVCTWNGPELSHRGAYACIPGERKLLQEAVRLSESLSNTRETEHHNWIILICMSMSKHCCKQTNCAKFN